MCACVRVCVCVSVSVYVVCVCVCVYVCVGGGGEGGRGVDGVGVALFVGRVDVDRFVARSLCIVTTQHQIGVSDPQQNLSLRVIDPQHNNRSERSTTPYVSSLRRPLTFANAKGDDDRQDLW